MKKRFFAAAGIIMLMLCVGCSSNANSSPDNVALEMANILSKGDYKDVSKLFDSDEVYIEGKAFEEYLNDNDLNIKGNKKKELVKEDTSNDATSKTVKIKIDTYTIPKILKGKYNITIEGKNIETVEEEITSSRSSNNENTTFIGSGRAYKLSPKASESIKDAVDKKIREYYNALFNSINSDKDYNELKSYFDSSNEDTIKKLEKEYNKLLSSKSKSNSYSEETNSEFSLDKIAYYDDYGVYYYSDDHIVVLLTCTMKYRHIFNYTSFMASMNDNFSEDEYKTDTEKTVLNIKKQNNKYIIEDGTTFVPSL